MYAAVVVPPASCVVVIASGTGFTATEVVAVFERPLLSVTFTVKVKFPSAGGVPAAIPFALRVSQEGRPVADQVNPPAPPVAAKVCV